MSGRSRAPRRRASGGFTLVEMLVAAGLVGLVLAAGSALAWQVSEARAQVDRWAEHHARADAALDAIASALHQSFRGASAEDRVLVGTDEQADQRPADRLRFFTVSHRPIRRDQPESDVHEMEFYLEQPPGQALPALMRRTDPTRNETPDGGGIVEQVAAGVTGLDVEYFDGLAWLPDWPEASGRHPVAVRVTIAVAITDDVSEARPYRRLVHSPYFPTVSPNANPTVGVSADGDERGRGGR